MASPYDQSAVTVLAQVLQALLQVNRRLARIEAALNIITSEENTMTQEIDDVKAAEDAEAAEIGALDTDVARLIADFEAKVNGVTSLSDADKAELLAVVNEAKANLAAATSTQATVDTADPAAPAV